MSVLRNFLFSAESQRKASAGASRTSRGGARNGAGPGHWLTVSLGLRVARSELLEKMRRLLTHAEMLSLADQVIVSLASFVSTVLIARFTAPSELGLYAFALSVVASCLCIQQALISTPYTVQRHRYDGEATDRAGTSLLQTGILSALIGTALTLIAAVVFLSGDAAQLAPVLWVLAGVAPFLVLREFARRFAFAHFQMTHPLMIDGAAALIQVSGLIWLGRMGWMSAATVYVVLGLSSAVASLVWLYRRRTSFSFQAIRLRAETRASWDLGKWLFAYQLIVALQASVIYWLLLWLAGTAATGIYAACMSIALISNPLILGVSNFLTAKFALTRASGGAHLLRQQTIQDAARLGVVLILFCAVVALAGDFAMQLLYSHQDYAGQANILILLAVGILVMGIGLPPNCALTSMEHTRVIFWTGFSSAALTAILVWLLVPSWGVEGAASGILVGNLFRSGTRWAAFLFRVRRRWSAPGPESATLNTLPAGVSAAVRLLGFDCGVTDWKLEPLGLGLEAEIYALRRLDQEPFCEEHSVIAIKLYHGPEADFVQRGCESLRTLHSAVNGSKIRGWRVHTPAPLSVCESPPAVVMSVVPGKPLSRWLELGELPSEAAQSLPYVVIAAARRLWSRGRIHGDLTLDNILCDVGGRDLSFVDPGVRKLCPFRDQRIDWWSPAAHDLTHPIQDVCTALVSALLRPVAFRRKKRFVTALLRTFLETFASAEERSWRLREIQLCTREHLMELGGSRYLPRALYERLQRLVGWHRVDKILAAVNAEADASLDARWEASIIRCGLGPATRRSHRTDLSMPVERGSGPGGMLLGIFEALDCAGIPYCVLHGYQSYPQQIDSDVDCVISSAMRPLELAAFFHQNRGRIGAELLSYKGYSFVFSGREADGSSCFLALDASIDYELNGLRLYRGIEVIRSRHRHHRFWVPSADIEFGGYLSRRISKGAITKAHAARLSELYRKNPRGCQLQISRFWGRSSAALIARAAASGDWGQVHRKQRSLATEMRWRVFWRSPWNSIWIFQRRLTERVKSVLRPVGGISVAFLGPDGAGKSSIISALGETLAGAFHGTKRYPFAPGVLSWLRPPDGRNGQPHASPQRSRFISVTRALCYWLPYYLLCYGPMLRLHLAHSRLVLHDRHLLDAVIDPKRYRYGGPGWLLWLIFWFAPKPDLIVLLDAPAEVLQSRKQEVPFEVSASQREAYRSLVGELRNGCIIDSAQALDRTLRDVSETILKFLTARTARRVGVDPGVSLERNGVLAEETITAS